MIGFCVESTTIEPIFLIAHSDESQVKFTSENCHNDTRFTPDSGFAICMSTAHQNLEFESSVTLIEATNLVNDMWSIIGQHLNIRDLHSLYTSCASSFKFFTDDAFLRLRARYLYIKSAHSLFPGTKQNATSNRYARCETGEFVILVAAGGARGAGPKGEEWRSLGYSNRVVDIPQAFLHVVDSYDSMRQALILLASGDDQRSLNELVFECWEEQLYSNVYECAVVQETSRILKELGISRFSNIVIWDAGKSWVENWEEVEAFADLVTNGVQEYYPDFEYYWRGSGKSRCLIYDTMPLLGDVDTIA